MKRWRKTALGLLTLLALLTLGGCASRPGPEWLQPTASVAGEKIVTLYVATTRGRDAADAFTAARAPIVSYLRLRVAIPRNHRPGEVEWPTPNGELGSQFATVERASLDRAQFLAEVERRRGARAGDVGVFVHGFNTNLTEAVFRQAQLVADAGLDATPVLFAWPSEGKVTGYIADKDAATFSRDQLTELLTELTRDEGGRNVTAFGHSMGAWLTVEAVRQLRLTGQTATLRRLRVILAAPDIDVDVFRMQLADIGPLNPPMTVLVSPDDEALRASQALAANHPRLGALDVKSPEVAEAVRRAGVEVVDISQLQTSDSFKHDRFATLAALIPTMSAEREKGQNGDLRQAGVFVLDAAGDTLAAPFRIAKSALDNP